MFQSMFLRMLSTYLHVQTVIRSGKTRRTRIRWQFFRTCENIFHYGRKTSKNTLFTTFSHRCLLIWLHIRDQRKISRRVTYHSPLCEDFHFSTHETGWYRNPAENRFWNLSNCHDDLLPIGNSYTKYWKIDQKSHPRGGPYCSILSDIVSYRGDQISTFRKTKIIPVSLRDGLVRQLVVQDSDEEGEVSFL